MHSYVIAIPNNPISTLYFTETVPEIERVTGEQAVLWPATTPENRPDFLHFRELKPRTIGTDVNLPLTETEKSVWYSHYFLWKHMAKYGEDAWIFEHDADVSRMPRWPNVEEHIGLAFGKNYGSMFCYFIRAETCETICRDVEKMLLIGQIDTWMYTYVTKYLPNDIIPQRFNMDITQLKHHGVTIVH